MCPSARSHTRRTVHGVDFSGAVEAGKRIWIATGVVGEGSLRIVDLRRAEELSDFGAARTPCLAALRRFIADRPTSVFGLDFPFGLPETFIRSSCWSDFVTGFAATYATADDLRQCAHVKRVTDRACGAPFAPGNLRMRAQTFFGIRDVLAPLVTEERACVLPMQYRRRDRPWVIEICPAVTLAREGLRLPRYKKRGQDAQASRAHILARLGVAMPEHVRAAATRDVGGDALDAIVAAYATARALASGFETDLLPEHLLEGFIFA